ncbi:GNAT family N-acetyltransferase [Acinetobacter sp. ESL0695]|uniref:GNAT family N-acetyltransferase n=1 Tax=Acinetobacter sp. ESL0695 TaxID=2983215 RepID=UPI0023EF8FC9|nr:GNAT family N-acetyltransferase [Acinetobacter sp. ESL0695]WEV48502.1 GNAT family N-acetyltransferase [Acinetobacter sp. ESL0695]
MDLINFREANFKDIHQIVDLVNISYRSKDLQGWTSEANIIDGNRINYEQLKKLFKEDSKLFVMFSSQELIGCVHIKKKYNSCYIGMLTSHPKFQNMGIGKKILKLAEEFSIKNYSINTFEISVLSLRKELIHFYERRGYKLTGERDPYPIDADVGNPLSLDIEVLHLRKQII